MKRVAIVQSSYIPWKGFFDLIAAVDEFVLYDDAQYTKRDWRNRNRIKTPKGVEWLSIPAGPDTRRRIRDVELSTAYWQTKHWKALEANYRRAPHFEQVAEFVRPIYLGAPLPSLSIANRRFIEAICRYLEIGTPLTDSSNYRLVRGSTERLVGICEQAGADEYLSGPSARDYIDEEAFRAQGVALHWADYSGYPEYPQLWGGFAHEVSILDLLFNCGKDARRFMKSFRR